MHLAEVKGQLGNPVPDWLKRVGEKMRSVVTLAYIEKVKRLSNAALLWQNGRMFILEKLPEPMLTL